MSTENFEFDLTHSSINFWVRHLMVSKVHGRFTKWNGTFAFDAQNPAASQVDVKIDAASIDTQVAQRDDHLRSADFFGVDQHPTIDFKSISVSRKGDDAYSMTGDITIAGVTKPITLEVEYAGRVNDPYGGERIGFSAHTSLSRKEFGLHWNQALEAGGVVVGDKIEINLEIEAKKIALAAVA